MARSSDRSAVYQREGSPFWWCRYRDSDGKLRRRTTGCRDREAAVAKWRQFEREAMGASTPAAPTTSLTDAIARMIEAARAKGLAKATIAFYEGKAAHLCVHFGAHSDLRRAVTARSVDAYVEARRAEVTQHTIAKELVTLRLVLKTARRRGEFDLDPEQVLPVDFATNYKPRETTLTETQVDGLLEHIHDAGFAAWVAFAVATGARNAEINRAQPHDVNFAEGHVYLRGSKTERASRYVPILPPTKALLERALRDGDGTERLFIDRTNSRTQLTDACGRAGIPRVTPNDLRRTYSTALEEKGVPHELLARLLGHTSTAMIEKVYGRARPSVVLAAVSDLYRDTQPNGSPPAQPASDSAGFLRARPDSNGRPADSKADVIPAVAAENTGDVAVVVSDLYRAPRVRRYRVRGRAPKAEQTFGEILDDALSFGCVVGPDARRRARGQA